MPPNCTTSEAQDCAKRSHKTAESSSDSWKPQSRMLSPNCASAPWPVMDESGTNSNEPSIDEVLPVHMLMEILSRLPDARDLSKCATVNNIFRSSFTQVKMVRFLCKLVDIRLESYLTPFKDTVVSTLSQLTSVERLRLEIEDEMQSNRLKEDRIVPNSLWLSEKTFIMKWLPLVRKTLQNLTVIDYGQQAIFHATPLLQLLSTHCKQLRKLELRNMYLDCRDVEKMNDVTTLILRCVKLTESGLSGLSKCMPYLETLTLVTVVGLKDAEFESDYLKVLCLGLATRVKSVKLTVKHLVKLQLKMACPENLIVDAPDLQCLAVCMDKRENTTVRFKNVKLLKELLMGASEFTTLTDLISLNPDLEKVFLDVPCMAFEDSGVWKGVLLHVPKPIPDMEAIRSCCPNLQTLSVGPGLWYVLEKEWYALEKENCKSEGGMVLKWPALNRLIVHLIVQFEDNAMAKSMGLLTALVKAMPTLTILEVYVHEDSKVEVQDFLRLKLQFPQLEMKCNSWKKGLRFECFSF